MWADVQSVDNGPDAFRRHLDSLFYSVWEPIWNDRSISLSSKIRLMRSLVTFIFLYACEAWTLTTELQRRIQVIEMGCYRKTLSISYKDHVTNVGVHVKI